MLQYPTERNHLDAEVLTGSDLHCGRQERTGEGQGLWPKSSHCTGHQEARRETRSDLLLSRRERCDANCRLARPCERSRTGLRCWRKWKRYHQNYDAVDCRRGGYGTFHDRGLPGSRRLVPVARVTRADLITNQWRSAVFEFGGTYVDRSADDA